MLSHLGIEFLEIHAESLKARIPVDNRALQPAGIPHGGASETLAESLGNKDLHSSKPVILNPKIGKSSKIPLNLMSRKRV
jgi:uncharacterized protein (TIGR00369 family)